MKYGNYEGIIMFFLKGYNIGFLMCWLLLNMEIVLQVIVRDIFQWLEFFDICNRVVFIFNKRDKDYVILV